MHASAAHIYKGIYQTLTSAPQRGQLVSKSPGVVINLEDVLAPELLYFLNLS